MNEQFKSYADLFRSHDGTLAEISGSLAKIMDSMGKLQSSPKSEESEEEETDIEDKGSAFPAGQPQVSIQKQPDSVTVQRDEDEAFMVAPDMLYKYYVFTALYYDALPALRGRKLGEGFGGL